MNVEDTTVSLAWWQQATSRYQEHIDDVFVLPMSAQLALLISYLLDCCSTPLKSLVFDSTLDGLNTENLEYDLPMLAAEKSQLQVEEHNDRTAILTSTFGFQVVLRQTAGKSRLEHYVSTESQNFEGDVSLEHFYKKLMSWRGRSALFGISLAVRTLSGPKAGLQSEIPTHVKAFQKELQAHYQALRMTLDQGLELHATYLKKNGSKKIRNEFMAFSKKVQSLVPQVKWGPPYRVSGSPSSIGVLLTLRFPKVSRSSIQLPLIFIYDDQIAKIEDVYIALKFLGPDRSLLRFAQENQSHHKIEAKRIRKCIDCNGRGVPPSGWDDYPKRQRPVGGFVFLLAPWYWLIASISEDLLSAPVAACSQCEGSGLLNHYGEPSPADPQLLKRTQADIEASRYRRIMPCLHLACLSFCAVALASGLEWLRQAIDDPRLGLDSWFFLVYGFLAYFVLGCLYHFIYYDKVHWG